MVTREKEVSIVRLTSKAKKRKSNKKENGFAMDLLSTCIVIIAAFLLILVMLSFAKTVEIKIDSDIVGKNYLYKAEEQGYFDTADVANIKRDLQKKGIEVTRVELITSASGGAKATTTSQVAYGSPVTLSFKVYFSNPMNKYLPGATEFGNINSIFKKELTYTLSYTTTSKW